MYSRAKHLVLSICICVVCVTKNVHTGHKMLLTKACLHVAEHTVNTQ